MKWFIKIAIRGYQLLVSPLTGPTCRHLPTCSEYAMIAIERFGALRGGWLAVCRLARCHPWGSHGFDPVPDSWETRAASRQVHQHHPLNRE